jgi:type III pantothenate kinase
VILVFDIGNTNIKIGVFHDDAPIDSLRLSAVFNKTSDEYWVTLRDWLGSKSIGLSDIKGAIISSVNPNLNYTIEHMVSSNFNVKPLVVGAGVKTGLNIKYDNPRELGSDRIVGAVAAYRTYGGPCIVIDCGTATTFNAVSEKGEFLGGAITFGLKTAAESLWNVAAKLPKIELNVPPAVINRTTIGNMQSGIAYGFVGVVEKIVSGMKKELGGGRVIATGGLSEIIREHTDAIDFYDRTLTLRGLNIIYKMNAGADK